MFTHFKAAIMRMVLVLMLLIFLPVALIKFADVIKPAVIPIAIVVGCVLAIGGWTRGKRKL